MKIIMVTIHFFLSLFILSSCAKKDFYSAGETLSAQEVPLATEPVSLAPELDLMADNDLCGQFSAASACSSLPIAKKPSITTVLLTLSQVEENAAQLIVLNIIKNTSPVPFPKILYLEDSNLHGEDIDDVEYVGKLLAGFAPKFKKISSNGLAVSDLTGYDLVWIVNPGYPLQKGKEALKALMAFKGSIVLQGDDMSQNMESLTGLRYLSNGTTVKCHGTTYRIDNQVNGQYQITMESNFLPGIPSSTTFSEYGNDIDYTLALPGTSILAYAHTSKEICPDFKTPAIVVRER